MKKALLAASLVLVAGSAVGCNSSNNSSAGAPSDVSEKDFCANIDSISKDMGGLGANSKPADIVKALKDAGKKIEDTGTPAGISADARKGFDIEVQKIKDLPDNAATMQDLQSLQSGLSKDEQASVKAFDDYVTKTCSK